MTTIATPTQNPFLRYIIILSPQSSNESLVFEVAAISFLSSPTSYSYPGFKMGVNLLVIVYQNLY